MLDSLLKKRRLPALDGVRAVSVLIVIIYHFGLQSVPGDLGVAAFFVLSGFLITWLLLKEEGETGRISLRNFYRRRVLRIFPAFYVFFFASFCVDYVRGQHWNGTMFLSGMFYFMNYYNASHGHPASAIAHAWSVSIEEQFYLMWPLLFLVSKNRKALLIAAICAVATWRTLLYAFWGAPAAYVYNAFDTRFDNLAVGCLLAVLLQDERVIKAASVRRWWVPLVPMSLLIISRSFTPSIYHYTIGYTVDAVLIAVWIVLVMQLQISGLWSWLEHPVTRYIGAISYPMYLYHIWAIGLAERSPVLKLPLAITFTIITASMSYHFIEKPFLKLKGRPAIRSEAAP